MDETSAISFLLRFSQSLGSESGSRDTAACVENALWAAWLVVPAAPWRTITRFKLAAL